MRWGSLSLLVCFLVAGVSGARRRGLPSSELTMEEKVKYKIPPPIVVLPPGVGLCMKGLPRDQCSIRYGGGRGLSEITRRSIVKRLEKRGWVKTKKLPRHINSVHICCHRKKFGMEIKLKNPKEEKPIEWPPKKKKKKPKQKTKKWTWKGIDEAEKAERGIYEKTQTSKTGKKFDEIQEKNKTIATVPQEKQTTEPEKKSHEIKKKARKTAVKAKRRRKETVPKHLEKKEKEAESGKNKTTETKWEIEPDKKEELSKEPEKKSGEDKIVKPEEKLGKEEEKFEEPKLPPWMTKDLDKKLPDQYLEGEELIDETDVW